MIGLCMIGLCIIATTITSATPWRQGQYQSILVHEVAHPWFYGLVGSNQVEHPESYRLT